MSRIIVFHYKWSACLSLALLKTNTKGNERFYVKDTKAKWQTQRLARQGYIQMRPTMRNQAATVRSSKENTANAIKAAYALSVSHCPYADILRLVDRTVKCREIFRNRLQSFFAMVQHYTDNEESLKTNTTVMSASHLLRHCFCKWTWKSRKGRSGHSSAIEIQIFFVAERKPARNFYSKFF